MEPFIQWRIDWVLHIQVAGARRTEQGMGSKEERARQQTVDAFLLSWRMRSLEKPAFW